MDSSGNGQKRGTTDDPESARKRCRVQSSTGEESVSSSNESQYNQRMMLLVDVQGMRPDLLVNDEGAGMICDDDAAVSSTSDTFSRQASDLGYQGFACGLHGSSADSSVFAATTAGGFFDIAAPVVCDGSYRIQNRILGDHLSLLRPYRPSHVGSEQRNHVDSSGDESTDFVTMLD